MRCTLTFISDEIYTEYDVYNDSNEISDLNPTKKKIYGMSNCFILAKIEAIANAI